MLNMGSIEQFYTLGRVLGRGSFATVRLATCKETGVEFAVKCIERKKLTRAQLDNLEWELFALEKCGEHCNVLRMEKFFPSSTSPRGPFPPSPPEEDLGVEENAESPSSPLGEGGESEGEEEGGCFYMVMELARGGELFDRIVEKTQYTEGEAKDAVRQIASALNFMHALGIAHRDLKPENVLYSGTGDDSDLKICDFGYARAMERSTEEDGGGGALTSFVGTAGYQAPEVIRQRPYDVQCDIWSLGVIIYVLLAGFPPFYAENPIAEMRKVLSGTFEFYSPEFDLVSDDAKDLIRRMLTIDATQRITAEDALKHPWLCAAANDAGAAAGDGAQEAAPILTHAQAGIARRQEARRQFRATGTVLKAAVKFRMGLRRSMEKLSTTTSEAKEGNVDARAKTAVDEARCQLEAVGKRENRAEEDTTGL